MTSSDEATISMSLDEYYEKCVLPKPRIPKHYGFHVGCKDRKAARLHSYKENPEEDDDYEEEDAKSIISIVASDTNLTDDFEDLCHNDDSLMDETEQEDNLPVNSSQWRIKKHNLNRLPGVPALVPNDSSRKQPLNSENQQNVKKKWRQSNYNGSNNTSNNNNKNKIKNKRHNNMKNNYNFNRNRKHLKNSIHDRLGPRGNQKQVVSNQATDRSHANGDSQINQPEFRNINPDGRTNLNNNQFEYYQALNNNGSNQPQMSASLTNSVNEFCPTNFVNPQLIIPPNYHSVPILSTSVPLRSNALIQTPNMYNVGFGQQPNPVNRNPSMCLADLMNMDSNNYVNLNVAEVARNAIMLLSTMSPQPSACVNVPEEMLQQRNNGPSQQPHGINMYVRPQTTNVPMYQRFR